MPKKREMTDAQRVRALLDHQKPDRVPIYPFAHGGFPVVYNKLSIQEAFNNPKVTFSAQRKTAQDFGWISTPMIGYASFGGWEFGGDIKWPSAEFAQAPSVTRNPVATPEEAMNLELPDVKKAGIVPLLVETSTMAAQESPDHEPFKIVFQLEGTFNTACNIAGADQFTRWLIKAPDAAHHLLRLATDFLVELAQYYKDTFGTEGLLPWGGEPTTSNQLISPKMFERFAFPYIKETHEKLIAMGYKHIFKHLCGEQNKNLPFWAEIPMGDPGFVSIGHEVDLERAGEVFPNDIIVGNLDTSIIQIGTPEQVYKATKITLEKGKKLDGGFILAPGCDLPPMAPVENVKAITRAANDFGWYG